MIMIQDKGFSCLSMLLKGYPMKRFNRCYPREMRHASVAILANRFGNRFDNLGRWIAQREGLHSVEVHFISGPARRDRRMEKFDLWPTLSTSELNRHLEHGTLPGLIRQINLLKSRLESVITDKTKIYISPGLEDGYTDLAYKNLLSEFKSVFSSWTVRPRWVRCPSFGGNLIPGNVLREVHGFSGPPAGIYNPDGVSVAFHDGEDYFKTMSMKDLKAMWDKHWAAKLLYIWVANMQGVGSSGSFNYPSIFLRDYVVTDNAILYGNKILKEW